MSVSVEIDDDVLGGEYPHPLFHVHQSQGSRSVWLRPRGVDGIDQRENVRVIVAAIRGAEHKGPAIPFAFFFSSRSRVELQAGLGIGHQSPRVVEFEGALDFEKLSIAVIGRPFANEAAGGLHDRFESCLSRIVSHTVDVKTNRVTVAPWKTPPVR